MIVLILPLRYPTAASSASDDHEAKFATVTGMPCALNCAAMSSRPREKILSTPRSRKTCAVEATAAESFIARAGLAPIDRSSRTAIAIACSRHHDAGPRKDDQRTNPLPPRYGFIALLEGLRSVSLATVAPA